jgi:hypothetical protein
VYARPEIDGERLDFGVSGKLIMNALVMYDRQTESYWSQILGRAVRGELAGTELEIVPYVMTTWANWKDLYPDTLALETSDSVSDPYDGYYEAPRAGVIGEARRDERLPLKAMVTGAVVDGQAKVWPWESLAAADGVVNDELAGVPLLLVHDDAVRTTVVWRRLVEGQSLTFAPDAEMGDARGLQRLIVDEQTGTRWQAWTGIAVEGELVGQRLEQLPATGVFWFGWKDFYPQTLIYGWQEAD